MGTVEVLILVVGMAVIMGAYYAWQARGSRERAIRLARRAVVAEELWFRDNYPCSPEVRSRLRNVLVALGTDLSVHWTQLRADDRFSGELALARRFGSEDGLPGVEFALCELEKLCNAPTSLPGLRFFDRFREPRQEGGWR